MLVKCPPGYFDAHPRISDFSQQISGFARNFGAPPGAFRFIQGILGRASRFSIFRRQIPDVTDESSVQPTSDDPLTAGYAHD